MNGKSMWSKWFDFVIEMAITKEIQEEQLTEFLKEEYQYYQKTEDRFDQPVDRRLTEDEFVSTMTEDIAYAIKRRKVAV